MTSEYSKQLIPQKLMSNTFKIQFKNKTFKYSVELDPVPEKDSLRIIGKSLRANKEKIYENFGKSYIFINNSIYSQNTTSNMDLKVTYDEIEYSVRSKQNL